MQRQRPEWSGGDSATAPALRGRWRYLVKVVDTVAQTIVAKIPTGGKCRADELAYDAADHIIVIANDQDSPPYLTFISTNTQSVLGRYTYPPSQINHGLEQPVWNPKNDRFYQAVPANANNTGSIDIIKSTDDASGEEPGHNL